MEENNKRGNKYRDYIVNQRLNKFIDDQVENGKTHKEVVDELTKTWGITDRVLSQWTTGFTRPDMSKLPEIAKYMGCSMDYLFGLTENMQVENQIIGSELGLTDEAIKQLKSFVLKDRKIKVLRATFNKKRNINPNPIFYTDIINILVCSENLYEALMYSIHQIIQENKSNIQHQFNNNENTETSQIPVKLKIEKFFRVKHQTQFLKVIIADEIEVILKEYVYEILHKQYPDLKYEDLI